MPNAILWQAAPVSRGNVLSTELASLASAAYSAAGTELDNSANLDQFACLKINLASSQAYVAGAYLQFFMLQAVDGSSYEDVASTGNPAQHALAVTVPLTSGTGARAVTSPWFRLPPAKVKFQTYNGAGAAMPSTTPGASTVVLYTSNDEVQ